MNLIFKSFHRSHVLYSMIRPWLILCTFFICCVGYSVTIDAQNTDAKVLPAKYHLRKAQRSREKLITLVSTLKESNSLTVFL